METTTTTSSPQPMEFITIGTENWFELVIKLNWIAIIITAGLIVLVVLFIRGHLKKNEGRTISLNGMSFGIGEFKCELKCGREVQEIAYQLWIELTTRKIAIPLEEDDVISEVYDSWYAAFSAIRKLLKSVPGECLKNASELIDITTKVLNEGLRPHLTKWQARYRSWYDRESKNQTDSPQTIQKQFPEYEELIADMKETNQNIINFADKMYEIAFGKKP